MLAGLIAARLGRRELGGVRTKRAGLATEERADLATEATGMGVGWYTGE